ncbi:MAG TPA: lipase maturation factor family protein [Gemmataceae bacterium]|jgi:hypothetical protein|nr:lipase maturation factor family protein [Gemmataceae bacterium]
MGDGQGLSEQRDIRPQAEVPGFLLSRWLFLRLLGVVYLAAFLSLWVQVDGLIGSRGILPVGEYLTAVEQVTGPQRFYLAPTLCWLDASDPFLHELCAGGVVLSGLLILGVAPAPVLFLLWVIYLSLNVAGQVFLIYQWDALLLETGFLAVFLAPPQLWPRLGHEAPPSRVVLWLFRWLLFRLVFGSGVVKLLSGDPTWGNLTALRYHYETQPLPAWTSWYMHQLPGWFQGLSVLLTFVAELVVPVGIFGPRRWRYAACAGIVGLQVLIAATGNYGFFNLLTVVLCVPLLEDGFFPARWRARLAADEESAVASRRRAWPGWLLAPLAAGILILSVMPYLHQRGLVARWPAWLAQTYRAAAAFSSVNSYGLFAVMTTQRHEIVVEGSDDGRTWLAYEFKWKPGDVNRRPGFTGLHMPRLDWQMWFAALTRDCRESPWFIAFLGRLLEGSPEVLALLDKNPFPDRPPRYIRAVRYDYHFTGAAWRAEPGAWWRRRPLRLYCPIVSRRDQAVPDQ